MKLTPQQITNLNKYGWDDTLEPNRLLYARSDREVITDANLKKSLEILVEQRKTPLPHFKQLMTALKEAGLRVNITAVRPRIDPYHPDNEAAGVAVVLSDPEQVKRLEEGILVLKAPFNYFLYKQATRVLVPGYLMQNSTQRHQKVAETRLNDPKLKQNWLESATSPEAQKNRKDGLEKYNAKRYETIKATIYQEIFKLPPASIIPHITAKKIITILVQKNKNLTVTELNNVFYHIGRNGYFNQELRDLLDRYMRGELETKATTTSGLAQVNPVVEEMRQQVAAR